MVFSLAWAFYFDEKETINAFLWTIGLTLIPGFLVWKFTPKPEHDLKVREGFVIVALGWILCTFFGSLPFYISGAIPNFTDAFFETMSGLTTTGATILTEIEGMDNGLLFWRSFLHWLGGMGIILLSLAILPLLGIGGMQLYKAEVPGPTKDKVTPRLKDTAKILWQVYLVITIFQAVCLQLAGMTFFDALCHSFGSIATGGFSTKNASIAAFNSPIIEYLLTAFMFMAGVNFALHYKALSTKKYLLYWFDKETLFYTLVIAFVTIVASLMIALRGDITSLANLEESFRHSIFQVVSIMTTTGYGTDDFELWPFFPQALLFIMMFIGGCAGSTSGGIKGIRILLLLKHARIELRKLVHPNGVFVVRYGKNTIQPEIVTSVLSFFLIFMVTFVGASLVLAALGLDLLTAFTASIACLASIGPGFGTVGPTENFAHIPMIGKWVLSLCMLMGRLELYTILILFSRTFWRH
ncbi:MAG: TrkH family potassium uptake protein [Calditrichaeota bacterium]|nr:MAG: TrkH family potassium uptake protein [Calditrichota bacterium]